MTNWISNVGRFAIALAAVAMTAKAAAQTSDVDANRATIARAMDAWAAGTGGPYDLLADDAEASRFTALQGYLEVQVARLAALPADAGRGVVERVGEAEARLGREIQDAANTRVVPAYTLTDIGLRWQFIEAASASLRVRNVFDETYARATYGATQWVLGDPRTVEASIHVAF